MRPLKNEHSYFFWKYKDRITFLKPSVTVFIKKPLKMCMLFELVVAHLGTSPHYWVKINL